MPDLCNKLGWVTSIEIRPTMNYEFVRSPGSSVTEAVPVSREIEFTVSGIAQYTTGVQYALNDWMNSGIFQPTMVREWRCLYCTSPNSIEYTHCDRCGAPRNFILG